jgi:hypothetical protein
LQDSSNSQQVFDYPLLVRQCPSGASIQRLGAPNLTIDGATANALSRSLNKGTSVEAEADGEGIVLWSRPVSSRIVTTGEIV